MRRSSSLQTSCLLLTLSLALDVSASPGGAKLRDALSRCEVEATRRLLENGADPNGSAAGGDPVLLGLAAGQKGCLDQDALEVAKLLDTRGARFDLPGRRAGAPLLVGLARKHLPRTLAFLASKGAPGATQALRAIVRGDDLESMRALLEARADPLEGVLNSSALMDAALANRAEAVQELLTHVQDKHAPKVRAAYEASLRRGSTEVVAVFERAGLEPPPRPAPARPRPRPLTAEELALMERLGLARGPTACKVADSCGDLIYIDCNAAADGPAFYIDRKAAQLLSTCGGACMAGCKDCPPSAWTCSAR
jgi:hypothetical protein